VLKKERKKKGTPSLPQTCACAWNFFQLLTFNFILLIQGVRVQVRSVYIEGRSQPSKGLYFFAYRIRITNNSEDTVQLLRRHWIITDANGRTENVR
jgi:hypothetical protein